MRLEIDLHDYDVVPLLNRMIEITGIAPWNRKFESLQQQLTRNNFLREYQIQHNGIELKVYELFLEHERTGAFPVALRDQQQYELYGFAAGLVRIYETLSPAGKHRLRGMLIDGLKPDNNLLSLQHEITTAIHFVTLGFDIEVNDIEKGSGVDFVVKRDGAELEVECKMFTADIGRQIHRKKVLALHHHLSDTIARIYQSANTGILIRVTIPNRLTCQPGQLNDIAACVSRGVVSGATITHTQACEVEVLDFPIATSPFVVDDPAKLSRHSVEKFIHARLGRSNHNLMIMFSPGRRAVVALVESAKPDEVLKGIYRQLRESSKGQFTRNRPGHLAIQIQDLTAAQMEALARNVASMSGQPIGLQVMTTSLLQSTNRTHIHSVAYRSHGSVTQPQGQPGTFAAQGIGFFVRNPSSPYYDDSRLRPMG